MKKKYSATNKDKVDWFNFTKKLKNVYDKDIDLTKQNTKLNKIAKIDLHGISLDQANKIVKKFIEQSFELGYKKVLIITGKGSRSKIYDDPYSSKKMNTLRHSVPEYIKNEEDFCNKISGISEADLKDGGEGAIYVYLKQQKKTIE